MDEAGYDTVPHLYKFEKYGVPQARHRIIIIGIRKDLNVKFRVPSPAPYKDFDNTCKTAIENPPIPKDAPNNELTNQSEAVVERLKHIKPGENAFTADIARTFAVKRQRRENQPDLQTPRSVKTVLHRNGKRRRRNARLSLGRTTRLNQPRTRPLADISRRFRFLRLKRKPKKTNRNGSSAKRRTNYF